VRRLCLCGFLIACGGDADKTADCDLSSMTSAATVQDRKIVGVAAQYVPDLGLASRDSELETSIAARRAAAWQIVEKVLQPVPLAEPKLSMNFPSQPAIPAWHTWYARDDFERVFKKLYRDLGPAGRMARAPIDANAGFAWNATAVDEVWPEQQYLDYLATIDTNEEAAGTGNASRVGYSPGAMGHLLESYVKLHECRLSPPPDPYASDAMRITVQTEAWRLRWVTGWRAGGFCWIRASHFIDWVTVQLPGGGPVHVFGAAAGDVSVDVSTCRPTRDPTCPPARCRGTACSSKDWRRHLTGELLPAYDTGHAMKSYLGGGRRGLRRCCRSAASLIHRHATGERPALPHAGTPHHDEGARSLDVDHAVVVAEPRHRLGADRPASLLAPGATTRCASPRRTSKPTRIPPAVTPARSAIR
jgi:hypothetical protein